MSSYEVISRSFFDVEAFYCLRLQLFQIFKLIFQRKLKYSRCDKLQSHVLLSFRTDAERIRFKDGRRRSVLSPCRSWPNLLYVVEERLSLVALVSQWLSTEIIINCGNTQFLQVHLYFPILFSSKKLFKLLNNSNEFL